MSRSSFMYEAACWPFQRTQRGVLAWVLAIVLALNLTFTSLREGVGGHETCDFSGQWMHGRAFYRERCEVLYLLEPGKELMAEGFTGKQLDIQINDVLKKGPHHSLYDQGIGGALYPPTASILFSLLATFIPSTAHALAVASYVLMCFGCGWLISRITEGRLQWGEASLLILFFPNNFMGLMLGQNQVLSLTILVAGWYCHYRGWPLVAGLVWGLFSFKPVFAVALVLVPLCLRSPRMLLGMALSGLLCVAATLPFTRGIDPWLRWLTVGRHAEQIYQTDRNWIWMSRDLVGLPRRKMWDAESFCNVMRHNVGVWQPGYAWDTIADDGKTILYPRAWLFWTEPFDWEIHQRVYVITDSNNVQRSTWEATLIGYLLLGSVAGITLLLSWRRGIDKEPANGLGAVFVLTGSLLCVFHFMHYDLVSFALPVLLALSNWGSWRWGRRIFFLIWYLAWLSRTYSFFFGNAILEVPWETYLLLVLWGWSGLCMRGQGIA